MSAPELSTTTPPRGHRATASAHSTTSDVTARRLMSRREVCAMVGLGRTTLQTLIDRGQFPKGRLLTPRCRRWTTTEIDAWIDSRK